MSDRVECYIELIRYWKLCLADEPKSPSLFFCHYRNENYDDFQPFIGIQAACEMLMKSIMRNKPTQAVLVFGFPPEVLVRSKADEYWPGSGALLDWAGAEYLCYGVSPEELRAAAIRVQEGALQPLPERILQQDRGGLLKLSSEIRHWLENRRTNVTGMRDDFRKALNGDRLSPFYLEPQPAVAEEHRKMVERLWAYEWLAADLASESGGVGPLRIAMADFERQWDSLGRARSAYREEVARGVADREQTKSVTIQLDQVLAAVRTAIDATRALDAAVQQIR